MNKCYVALGSNLGSRVSNICKALDLLKSFCLIKSTSHLYETLPVSEIEQPNYINAVIELQTSMDPVNLLRKCKEIEKVLGRKSSNIRWGAREIDLDILFYNDTIASQTKDFELTIPHKSIQDREFVLRPLCDLAPNMIHPFLNVDMKSLLLNLEKKRGESKNEECVKIFAAAKEKILPLGKKTYVQGILNLTPDSFSDGSKALLSKERYSKDNVDIFIQRALNMERDGADIIDIGGESTKPNAVPVSEEEELERVIPVIAGLKDCLKPNTIISIDTMKSKVALSAFEAGATLINDVTAGRQDKDIFQVSVENHIPMILMHSRGNPQTMTSLCHYGNFMDEMCEELNQSIKKAKVKGVYDFNICVDPGIGFAKDLKQNLEILKDIHIFKEKMGHLPVLVGPSRKGFLGKILNEPEPKKRQFGTAAAVVASIVGGSDFIRVHDVKEMKQIALVADAIYRE